MDIRLLPLAVGLWVASAMTLALPPNFILPFLSLCISLFIVLLKFRNVVQHKMSIWFAVIGCLVGFVISLLRIWPLHGGEVAHLAAQHRVAQIDGTVLTDPVLREQKDALTWVPKQSGFVAIRTETIRTYSLVIRERVPVLLFAQNADTLKSLTGLIPGEKISIQGSFSRPGTGSSYAALVSALRPVDVIRGPPRYQRWASTLRTNLRLVVSHGPTDARSLVPGLTLGDSLTLPNDLALAMRNSGLSHLIAVSGANVTLILGLCLAIMTRITRRRYVIYASSLVSLLAFVVLVRPQPSVLRAAVMGAIALLAGYVGERKEMVATLCASTTVLLIADPWLAKSWGFALSVGATAGLIIWNQRILSFLDGLLPRRMPLWLVQTLAVSLCAQIAVFPMLVAMGSQLSLASIPANVLAVPLASVVMLMGLMLLGVSIVSIPCAKLFSPLATFPAWGIAQIARFFSRQEWLIIPWPVGFIGSAFAVITVVAGIHLCMKWKKLDRVFQSQVIGIVLSLLFFLWRPPHVVFRMWPVPNWLMVQCDVGQGDAAVINVGPGTAVVVDTGPDPDLLNQCLSRLNITYIPVLVLTHFHADHVGGL